MQDGGVEVKGSMDTSICASKNNAFKSSLLYDNFSQKRTLTGATYQLNVSDSESESEDETLAAVSTSGNGLLLDMSDDQLFKLCGGATAHKGARHGIRMTAKMKRLEAMAENDASLVADWKRQEEKSQALKTPITKLATMPTTLWKHRTTSTKAVIAYQYEESAASKGDARSEKCGTQSGGTENLNFPKKKKKIKNHELDESLLQRGDEEENESSQLTGSRRKKRKKSSNEISIEDPVILSSENPKKKTKKYHDHQKDNSLGATDEIKRKGIQDTSEKGEVITRDTIVGDEDANLMTRINCSPTTLNSQVAEDRHEASNHKSKKKTKKIRTQSHNLKSCS
ncbi:hypothetical protein FHG87_000443 [Trinorchestia longiramus]|nr:hypothetical protein FHG87_000443 [Trinorchestia longiramus]